jgi:mRNA-degrading endonuclease toxin of MazEF toxin-antitoxin module
MRTPAGSSDRPPRCLVRSGDVVTIDFGVPLGSTPALVRPAVVVTADLTLVAYSTTFHVVPVTTNVARAWASDVPLIDSGLPQSSVAQCHLCAVVDQLQIVGETTINVGQLLVAQIRSVLGDLLDISS